MPCQSSHAGDGVSGNGERARRVELAALSREVDDYVGGLNINQG